ncbi:hypothetical protein PPSIR1_26643 [Plesiocystis pacifica SIR-1]|uniref:Uncharacterized protein n=1 Tax=Plesiocystis pacifica SIR-1 TaxID=391625 RepID=A6GA94_9BACT|nr:hypothetical protein [Plesiocystis pacifica]EDM77196.1 hypothetical protein PPSIR1_26643 [Plesiocystis pacifica SIR-1]
MHRRAATLLGLATLLNLVACTEDDSPDSSYTGDSDLRAVQVTKVELGRDLAPAYVNERIPITIGVTASSGVDGEVPTESVPVVVSFVDPEAPDEAGCSSNGMLFDIVGDGEEHEFSGFIWPPTNCANLAGGDVTLKIEMDPAADQPLIEPLVLSQARADEPANAACEGCVQEFPLEFTPDGSVDIEFAALNAESSVGVIPPLELPTEGEPEKADPILVAQNLLVFNGRDPYESVVNPDTIPAELLESEPDIAEALRFGRPADQIDTIDDLPAPLHISYTISAANDGETWLPLSIGEDGGKVDEAVVTELLPGTANVIAHDLFLDGEAYDAVLDPEQWLGEEAFVVRSCFDTDFEEFRAEDEGPKCKTLDVLLIPDGDVESGAAAFSFGKESKSSHGNSRIKLESLFATDNSVGLDGVFSDSEARLTVKGKIGKSFTLDLVKAHAILDAPLTGAKSVDMGLRLFNNDIYTYADEADGLTVSEDVTFSKSTTIVKAKFMFGPVPVSFDLGAGGAVGIFAEGSANLLTGEEGCRPFMPLPSDEVLAKRAQQEAAIAQIEAKIAGISNQFLKDFLRKVLLAPLYKQLSGNTFDTGESELQGCVVLEAVAGPTANLTASAFGGVSVGIASAGVQLDLIIAQLDLPLSATLAVGRNGIEQFLAYANTQLDLIFQPLQGDLKLVGKLKIGFFKKSKSVSIVKFNVKPIEKTLVKRSTLATEILNP